MLRGSRPELLALLLPGPIAMRTRCLLPAAIMFVLLAVGCDPPAPSTGTVMVSVSSELRAGVDIGQLNAVMRVGGAVVDEPVFSTQDGTLKFPAELAFKDLEGGTPVELDLDVFRVGNTTKPLLVRSASTEVIADRASLLRVRLESECVIPPGGAACPAEQTCIAGVCGDPRVAPALLEAYTPASEGEDRDVCKPAGGGDPIVLVGQGQGDYLPLDDLEEAQVEAGPQGGHHIWVAIRVKNLGQSGSITSIRGSVPELQYTIDPYRVIFTLDPDEGGFCTLAGLRFQIDQTRDIHDLLGKLMDVEVAVKDHDGVTGIGKRTVKLSQTIL